MTDENNMRTTQVTVKLGIDFEEAQKRLPELLEKIAELSGADPEELAKTAKIKKAPPATLKK